MEEQLLAERMRDGRRGRDEDGESGGRVGAGAGGGADCERRKDAMGKRTEGNERWIFIARWPGRVEQKGGAYARISYSMLLQAQEPKTFGTQSVVIRERA